MKEHFLHALRNLFRRKLRSWLTMIGIFIGIAALVSLTSLGQGLQTAISDQFQKLGTDKIIVTPGSVSGGPPGSFVKKMTDHDYSIITRANGVKGAARSTFHSVTTQYNSRTKFLTLFGVPDNDRERKLSYESQGFTIAHGRDLRGGSTRELLIGYGLAAEDSVFGKILKAGDTIKIEGTAFHVVGSITKTGNPIRDNRIYYTLSGDETLTGQKNAYDFIFVKTTEGADPNTVAENIKQGLRRDRHEKKGEEDFGAETLQSVANAFGTILSIVQAVIIGIASISVVVGGVGIMNTMYTAVLERTREIGIMKAIGARTDDILKIFLIESGLLGLVGGAIGIFIGIGLSKSVQFIATQYWGSDLIRAEISPWFILGSLLFSFLIGTFSGALPAYQASQLKPVDALRYE